MISYRDQTETTRSLLLCGFSCTGDGYMTMISYRDQIETTRSLLLYGFSCTGDGYMTMISYRDQTETTRSLLLCGFSCTGDGYMTMISYRDQIETTCSLLLCGFSCTRDVIKEKILFTCNRWFLHFPFDLYTQKYLLSSNYHDMNIISLFSNVTHYNDITNITYYHWYDKHTIIDMDIASHISDFAFNSRLLHYRKKK